eukprot:TRINITY_DN8414_c0_g1_i2.p1 TRINITY_DN8414_c0_g1~~TRINITY_DN8414_c0_g1_i2.p1  ORF type:complete len:540 (-),score=151.18 TRINITY_DN8414_c0_g1_i2:160-1779(-)
MGGVSCAGCCNREEVGDLVVKAERNTQKDGLSSPFLDVDIPTPSSPSRPSPQKPQQEAAAAAVSAKAEPPKAVDIKSKFKKNLAAGLKSGQLEKLVDQAGAVDEDAKAQKPEAAATAAFAEAPPAVADAAKAAAKASPALELPIGLIREKDKQSAAAGPDDEPAPSPEEVRDMFRTLRVCEAARALERGSADESTKMAHDAGLGEEFQNALELHMEQLRVGLERLGEHPGLNAGLEPASQAPSTPSTLLPEFLSRVRSPTTPASSVPSQSQATTCFATGAAKGTSAKRDILEVAFDLDDEGHHVEGVVEFFPDGSASIQWTALELPVPLPYVLCLVNEIDLLGEVAPYIKSSGVIKQFPWNEADRLVRVVSEPPIPFVSGVEAVAQRYGFDLLDTPWEAFLLVETGAEWMLPPGASDPKAEKQWRGVPKPPPFRKGLKEVETKAVVALGRPVGPDGQLTTVLFSGTGDVKIPRSMLPNWLITWLVKLIGRFIFSKALDRIKQFDTTEHGRRLKGSDFYRQLGERIEAHSRAKTAKAASA